MASKQTNKSEKDVKERTVQHIIQPRDAAGMKRKFNPDQRSVEFCVNVKKGLLSVTFKLMQHEMINNHVQQHREGLA